MAVKEKRNSPAGLQTVQVSLPIGEVPKEQAPGLKRNLNVYLSGKPSAALRRIRDGFRAQGATFDDGRPVWTTADAVRHLLHLIGDSAA